MRELTNSEKKRLEVLRRAGVSSVLLGPTRTGLDKGLMDATNPVREYLSENYIHDFEKQENGPDNKKQHKVLFIMEHAQKASEAAFYRATTRGDPRIRITNLKSIVSPNQIIALIVRDGDFYALNLSTLPIAELLSHPDANPLKLIVGLTVDQHFRKAEIQSPENPLLDLDYNAEEGSLALRLHLVRERDPKLVEHKKLSFLKKHERLFCEACGFDFIQRYGTHGSGFIECHHIIPLASKAPRQPTQLKDLILLCSNCHRMVHRKKQSLSIKELKGLIMPLRS